MLKIEMKLISKTKLELKTSMESSCLKIYEWIISELEELTEVIRFTDYQGTLEIQLI